MSTEELTRVELPVATVVKASTVVKETDLMSDRAQRSFILIDEWGGILVLLYLHKYDPSLFWPFLIPWAIAVYGISYPWLWWHQYRKEKEAKV